MDERAHDDDTDGGEVVLVLGATGYVGGRLVPRRREAGHRVRCLVRTPGKLSGLAWAGDVEVVRGDLLDPPSVQAAFDGADVVYHLVHSMGSATEFAEADRRIARTVARAAESTSAASGRSTRTPRPTCAAAPRSRRS
jgi:uncharacterized protein YbjT (DUF2867 family)